MNQKKYNIIKLVLLLFTFTLSAQQPSKSSSVPNTLIKLSTTTDTIQYSLGAYVGQWLLKSNFMVTNEMLFKRGMDDVLQNRQLSIADTIISPLVSNYHLSIQNARSRAMEEQLFAALKGKTGVGVLPEGVHYIVMKTGSGIRPAESDTVVIDAIGVLPDGTVFEDTSQKKLAITAPVGSLIPGLKQVIQIMPEGSVWRIFIPSVLAYGSAGLVGVIPPNTALIFDITLGEVRRKDKSKK